MPFIFVPHNNHLFIFLFSPKYLFSDWTVLSLCKIRRVLQCLLFSTLYFSCEKSTHSRVDWLDGCKGIDGGNFTSGSVSGFINLFPKLFYLGFVQHFQRCKGFLILFDFFFHLSDLLPHLFPLITFTFKLDSETLILMDNNLDFVVQLGNMLVLVLQFLFIGLELIVFEFAYFEVLLLQVGFQLVDILFLFFDDGLALGEELPAGLSVYFHIFHLNLNLNFINKTCQIKF